MTTWTTRPLASAVLTTCVLAAWAAGCDNGPETRDNADTAEHTGAESIGTGAANLRVALNLLLSEHLIAAAKTTGAALGSRPDEYEAYYALLAKNGSDLGAYVRGAYGDAAAQQFNGIWNAHNSFFVDYTTGVATMDTAKQEEAVTNLTETYVPQFSALLSGATGLPEDTLESLTMDHVVMTKAIVDAQAEEDWPAAYAAIRSGFAQMAEIANPLSSAIASQQPDKFPGNAMSPAVDFRVTVNELFQEHLYLATFSTNAALGGRAEEFEAAAQALNENGTDIGAAVGDLYGDEAEDQFNGIWSAHNSFFVDYTEGVAAGDTAKQNEAVADLTGTYVPQFSALLSVATGIPEQALADLITDHVVTTKAVVDAQAAGDQVKVVEADRTAAQHMQMLADPLSEAIVVRFPDNF